MRVVIVVVLLALVGVGGVMAWRAHNQAAAPAAPGKAAAGAKESLYLAVPQGLFLPVSKVIDKYQAEHPSIEFPLLVDTPEAMAQATEENKEKPDIFISPGGHEIEVLRQRNLVDPKT